MIKLYNTLTRSVEEFKPIEPGVVRFYSCGPTVYHFAHIGNLRAYVTWDLLKRMFMASGYDVRHITNLTDVGHLVSDGDEGEDKMEKGSRREGKSAWDIAKFYTDAFMKDSDDLNIIPPVEYTKATDFIAEQIDLVQKLEALGFTYEIPGDGVYYDVSKFPDYEKLGRQSLDDIKAGTSRIGENEGKRHPADFALWKFSKPGENRQMEWESPWGVGFPGWAIECTAMILSRLGNKIDIHSGGVDHIKVHHSNEIAQADPVVGHPLVNYWMHSEFLNDTTGKMSKSKGEFLTLTALKERGFRPVEYRYFLLLASYRTKIDFSFEALGAAATAYKNLVKRLSAIPELDVEMGGGSVYAGRMLEALQNDLNSAAAIAILQEALKSDAADRDKLGAAAFADSLLGLTLIEDARALNKGVEITPVLQQLLNDRAIAKQEKNYERSDAIRAEIEAMGYVIEDSKDGAKLTRK